MANPDVQMSLETAVGEVLGLLTGLELEYDPSYSRFHAVTRALNRALRANATEAEWSWYATTDSIGAAVEGARQVELNPRTRVRSIADDSIRLVDAEDNVVRWAYLVPRDALHKYQDRELRASVTRTMVEFSRPFWSSEAGLSIVAPLMREPKPFRMPRAGQNPGRTILSQLVDFEYPDLIVARAAYLYAQSDPVMQPRVQTLENDYKTLMYQLIERDERFTDAPYANEFIIPIKSGSMRSASPGWHPHPHANVGRL